MKRKGRSKKAQMEFAWIFAVIVGALILFFAFYFVGTKLLSQRYEQATVEAQSLDVLMNPFTQIGEVAQASATPLSLQQSHTFTLTCTNEKLDGLGYNEIVLTRKGTEGITRIVRDKYIFAEQEFETKKFQALSMPFEMPWRVADIVILWPYDKKYCFVGAPLSVKEKLGNEGQGLNISSIYFDSCPQDSAVTKVCFTGSGCDIRVAMAEGSTNKQGKTIYFTSEALMYASIFSDPEIYKCNVQRLASRIYYEASIYEEKAKALSQRGCSASFNLLSLKQASLEIAKSGVSNSRLQALATASQAIKQQNNMADCSLF